MFGLSTKVLAVAAAATLVLAGLLGLQTWRLGNAYDQLAVSVSTLALCRELNKGNEADIALANKSAAECLERVTADQKRADDLVIEAQNQRAITARETNNRLKRMRESLAAAENSCSIPLPDYVDCSLRAGTPYENSAVDCSGYENNGSAGGID